MRYSVTMITRSKIRFPLILAFFFLFATVCTHATNSPPAFPSALTVIDKGELLEMRLTGRSKRMVLFFRVYEIAHYAEIAQQPPLSLQNVVSDDRGKAIMIAFKRKLDRDQIRDEFAKSLRKNARKDWLDTAEPTIELFLQAIDRGARDGDTLIFYWLEGGRLSVEFNGKASFVANDTAFARLIWSIWFGDNPACDREQLLARVSVEGNA